MTIWIVSTTGTAGGAGTVNSPLDIDTVIGASSPVAAGDTVYLRVGTYTPLVAGVVTGAEMTNGTAAAGKGVYTFYCDGSSGNNITFQNYPGEAVRINGAVHVSTGQGSYLTFRGIEIAPTPTDRTFANRPAVDFPGIYVSAPGVVIDRCYLHDLAQVYIMGTGGCTVTQNIIGLCGMYLSDEGYTGYSIYTHNASGGTVTIKKNIFIGAYNGYNLGFQSAGANAIRDYDTQYNVLFAGGALWGSASGVDDNNSFTNNVIYNPARTSTPVNIYTYGMRSRGYDNANAEDWTAQNNLWWFKGGDTPFYNRAQNINFSNNTIVGVSGVFAKINTTIYTEAITMDNNTYYCSGTGSGFTHPSSGIGLTLAQWQAASGWDLNSTYTVALPTSNATGVLTDDNYNGRGILYAFNFTGATSITFDLSTLNITDGARCRYTNAMNKSEYVDFTYSAASPTLTVSMLAADWSAVQPTAFSSPRSWFIEPFPDFGAFLVEEIETPNLATVQDRDLTATVRPRHTTATVRERGLTATVR